jgi:hypothetical protein
MRRSLIKFDNLTSINGKKIVKAYLKILGYPRWDYCTADPKEVFVHRVDENYGNILKYSEMPSFDPIPEASIMVGETTEEVFYWDVTSLVKSWINKIYPNYGLLLKENDPFGNENSKQFYRTSKPPQLKIIYLTS